MSEKPYAMTIREDGEWIYMVDGKEVDVFDYRRAVAAHTHAERLEADRHRGERPLGVHIPEQFHGNGVWNPQLAKAPWDRSKNAHYTSYRDLDRKAEARGFSVNYSKDGPTFD